MKTPLEAFQHVTVGVADLDVALALWVERFGFEIAAQRQGPDAELARLWSLVPGDISRQALVRTPGQTRGMLHLVEFIDPTPPVRSGAQSFDSVPKNLDVHVVDLPARFDELTAAGYVFSTAKFTEADQSIGGRFREGHLKGHDDVNIVLVEELGVQPWEVLPYTPAGYVGVGPLITVVPDWVRETAFFVDVLGLQLQSEAVVSGPEIERMIGLPPGTGLATAVLGGAEAFGSMMMVDYEGVEGADLYPKAKPKALGVLHITFRTKNLAPLRGRLAAAGRQVVDYGAVNTLFGAGELIAFSSPSGLRIEVLQGE
ncbi:MAG: VOC family protein [Gammaproteobacteria bacterium]